MKITELNSRSILSSQGDETVEVTMVDETGRSTTASVPAGISAGKYEVAKVGVDQALAQIEAIRGRILGRVMAQDELDLLLAGAGMGGNASLAVSAVWWKAHRDAVFKSGRWPKLLLLVFEGGEHGYAGIAMQEFALIEESLETAVKDYKKMQLYLEKRGVETLVGAEGGFSPIEFDDARVLSTMKEVFPDELVALDAAGSFKADGINYEQILENYRVVSIEDPYSDDEWDKWREFYGKFGQKIMVVGDDLTVTNVERIKLALNPQVINAVVIKPNQIGTISGALQAVKLAREAGLKIVVSHRGDETDDDWIVDFALEAEADYVKLGGMDRGERIAKYNRLRALGMK